MSTQTDAAVIEAKNLSGRQVGDAFGLSEDSLLGRRRGLNEPQKRNMDKLIALKRRLALTGVRPAYILNMNPYSLRVNSVMLDDVVVPACPVSKPYIIHAINEERYDWRDEGDDNMTPSEWVPIILVREFEREYYKKGGVVVFEFSGNPKARFDARAAENEIAQNPSLAEKIKEADERMIAYASEKFQEAETAFHSPGRVGYRDITDHNRALTSLLYSRKMLPELPKWFKPTKVESDLGEACQRCKADTKKGAVICSHCGHIIDPAAAFLLGDISHEEEVGKRALSRLTRERLKELNISQFIEETLEERDKRLEKAASKK